MDGDTSEANEPTAESVAVENDQPVSSGESTQERDRLGLLDLPAFKMEIVDGNRGKPIVLIRFENLRGMDLVDFLTYLRNHINSQLDLVDIEYCFHYIEEARCLLMGISPIGRWDGNRFPNIDNAIGRLHEESQRKRYCRFDFGVGRTQANYISSVDEIFFVLDDSSRKNLRDNLIRWSWTFFNRANSYFSGDASEAVIQPTLFYDRNEETFSVKGGEVFVGGTIYQGYYDLINDIPEGEDLERIELLILEKLIIACERTPGVLKFNISPQTMLDTFANTERVNRLNRLLHARGLTPSNVRFELVEKPYDEEKVTLKEVCARFFEHGITFAADDFGVKSQSHQVILDLGLMIKEFKLDPISFKFKPDEDRTKFLDNLAFIAYCKRLADNRDAFITAEAVEDYDTLSFLLEHQINQYQANIFCQKMPVVQYREEYEQMSALPAAIAFQILTDPTLLQLQRKRGNIFHTAREAGLFS